MMTVAEEAAPWQLEFEKVEQRCGYLLTSGQWSDCIFLVGSDEKVEMPAHKLVLAMASEVFEAMFYGVLSENNESKIPVADIQPETFKVLLQYIYTGHVNIGSFDMAWKLWHGAKKYMLPHMVKECNKYICSVLSPKNACRAYEFARFCKDKTLTDKCIEIISRNTKEVLNDNSINDAELDTLITVLSLDHLNVDSELDLFYTVAKFAEAEQKRQKPISSLVDSETPSEKLSQLRQKTPTSEQKGLLLSIESCSKPPTKVVTEEPTADKEKLKEERTRPASAGIRAAIEKIRFLSLTPQQFAEGPARSGLLTEAESFAVLMNIASADCPVPMPTGFSECRERRQQRTDAVDEIPNAVAATEHITSAEIVQGLSSGDVNTMTAAARAARDMLSKDTTSQLTRSQLVEAGAIPALVAALDPSFDLQLHAAGALAIIASGTGGHTLPVVAGGAIPKLIALLAHGGEVLAQAAAALGNIAEDAPVYRDAILNLGALPAMLPYMHPNTPLTQLRTYVRTYCNMCWHDNPRVSFELLLPALPHISELFALTDEEVLADACSALSGLTDGSNERLESAQATPGLTERLIALLGHPAPKVQKLALRVLGNMLSGTDVQTDRCLDAGCLDHIINLLQCGAAPLVKEAAWAASNILGGTHTQIQEALDKQILEPLRKVLADGTAKCQKEAAWAISNLCLNGTAQQLNVLVSARLLEPYCLLLSSPDNRPVLTILEGLTSLLQKVEYCTRHALCAKLREIGVPELLQTLQRHDDENVIKHIRDIVMEMERIRISF